VKSKKRKVGTNKGRGRERVRGPRFFRCEGNFDSRGSARKRDRCTRASMHRVAAAGRLSSACVSRRRWFCNFSLWGTERND